MGAMGDVAELVAKWSPHEMDVYEDGSLIARFTNTDHAFEFKRALELLVLLSIGEQE
jgi:hypothetical protein